MSLRLIAFPLALALLISSTTFSQTERGTSDVFSARLVEPAGDDWHSTDVMLNFEADRIVVHMPKNEVRSESIRYADINAAEYSHSKSHRKIGSSMAVAANVFAVPLMMRKVDDHWLTLRSGTNKTFLNLNNATYQAALAAFEAKAGMKVAGWNVTAVAAGR